MVKNQRPLPMQDHDVPPEDVPDLRATHYDRGFEDMQIGLAKRMFALCCDRYTGPDPLGLGSGWCTSPANLPHEKHVDQFGRSWTKTEPGSRASVTIAPVGTPPDRM